MLCNCGGELRAATVEHFSRWGDGPRVLVTGVPVERCERCGLQYLADDVARRLEEIVRAGQGEPLTIAMTRFDLAPREGGIVRVASATQTAVYLSPAEHVERALGATRSLRRHWLQRPGDRQQDLLGDQIVADLIALRTLLARGEVTEA